MGDHRRAMALSTTQIYVSNLPAGTTDDRLNAAFEQFGAIEDCFVPQRKRFGFVTFAAEADATKALTAMNGKSLDAAAAADASEEVIAVVAATPKPAEKEGEKKQPAAKKQPKKKKEPKAQQKKKEPKEQVQQGAPAEKSNRRKRANKKAPAAKRAVATFQDRMNSYDSDLGAKCLLLGYAHWEVANPTPTTTRMRLANQAPDSLDSSGFKQLSHKGVCRTRFSKSQIPSPTAQMETVGQ